MDEQERPKHVFDRYVRHAIAKTAVQLSRNKAIADTPALSLVSIISSLRNLAVRGSRFAEFSAVPGDFLSWRQPSLTLSGLVLYTVICMRPQTVLIIPFVFILGTTFIPQYAKRYMYPERIHKQRLRDLKEEVAPMPDQADQGEKDLVNMLRSVQASLSNVVGLLEWVDHMQETFGDFSDPHESSALFIFCIVLLFVAIAVSNYVPLKAVFAFGGWLVVGLMHPGVRSHLDELAAEVEEIEEKIRETRYFPYFYGLLQSQFSFSDLEVIRQVEVFEIERQGLTSRFWEPVGFISVLNPKRGGFGHRFHHVAKDIDAVQPPPQWYFNEAESWLQDSKTQQWLEQRSIDLPVVNGWVHSHKGSHRARRHVRKCFYNPDPKVK